jgi:hypothetical protein
MDGPVRIFILYSRADEEHRQALERHLGGLPLWGLVTWSARPVEDEDGADRPDELDAPWGSADLLLILLSPDFLASSVERPELTRALQRYCHGRRRILQILLRPCDWSWLGGGRVETLPGDGRPISTWAHPEAAWTHVKERLYSAISEYVVWVTLDVKKPRPLPAALDGGRPPQTESGIPAVSAPPLPVQLPMISLGFPMEASGSAPHVLDRAASPASSVLERAASALAPDAEPVHLGASAPRVVRPGSEFTARFTAYHPALRRAVQRQLRRVGARNRPHLELAELSWSKGTTVTVSLSGEHLSVSSASQPFVWQGGSHHLDFDVRVVAPPGVTETRLKFDVSIEGAVVARLRLDLGIRRGFFAWLGGFWRRAARTRPARTAFASYASEDRPRVADRIASLRIAAGLDVFLDCLSLQPNDLWKPRLASEIHERHLFMLFWSEHAARSPWVDWEWRTALADKGIEAIQAHPLDPWPRSPLPPELQALHFGDPLMGLRESALQTENKE